MISPIKSNVDPIGISSSQNGSTAPQFNLDQFESELTALVNQYLQKAGVNGSEAHFSFQPAADASTPAAAAANGVPSNQAPAISGSIVKSADTTSQDPIAASNWQPFAGAVRRPGIDTHGSDAPCIYDPYNNQFCNDGNTAGDRFFMDSIKGQPVDYDAVVRGFQQVFGADSHAQIANGLMTKFGDTFVQQYMSDNPGSYNPLTDIKPLTDFQTYGAFGSFTGSDGLSHYFDEKGNEHLSMSAANVVPEANKSV